MLRFGAAPWRSARHGLGIDKFVAKGNIISVIFILSSFISEDPTMIPTMKTLPKTRTRAFSLVEVAITLGIFGFALIPLLGLLTSGLTANRSNLDRSIKAQILSWVQGDTASQFSSYSVDFDEFGSVTTNSAASYRARMTPKLVSLPGSSLSLTAWDVVIEHQPSGNRIIEQNTVWGSR